MTTEHELDADAKTLAEMGYTQELHRGMSAFSNFAIFVLDHLDTWPAAIGPRTRSRWSPAARRP